jgi:hypothetical protein
VRPLSFCYKTTRDQGRYGHGPATHTGTHADGSAIILYRMDPLALLPYALAAGGGRVGSYETATLVAAGLTLLQRSAPLVRALSGRRAGLLLRSGPEWVVALAASEGRGAVVLDPLANREEMVTHITTHGIGAVFTTTTLAERLPADIPIVLLDEAPARARIVLGDRDATVDLGSHFGLDLAGDTTVQGAEEECLVYAAQGTVHTHRQLLTEARRDMERHQFTPVDRTVTLVPLSTPGTLSGGLIAPLLAGGFVHVHVSGASAMDQINRLYPPPTMVVGDAESINDVSHHDGIASGQIHTVTTTPQS